MGHSPWVDQPICTIFMSAIIPSLPFEHCRESCFIRVSKAWSSMDVLLWLLLLPPPLLVLLRTRLLLALSLILFSAPSALSPAEIQRLPNGGSQFQKFHRHQHQPPEPSAIPATHCTSQRVLQHWVTLHHSLMCICRNEMYLSHFVARKQTSPTGTCQEDCS